MTRWLLDQPGGLRFLILLAVLLVLLACQRAWPARGEQSPPGRRARNIGLSVISTIIVQLLLPLTAVVLALQMEARGVGALATVSWPQAVEFVLAIVVLDLAIYWQHRWFHRVPLLWRMHRVHHSDTQFEVTLGLRFHPAEIVLSMLYKLAVVALLGPSPVAVVSYEILLAAFSLFSHTDLAIPQAWDRRLRRLVVTPDWHRVHHSLHRRETDSNYGNFLSLWDRIFRSYIAQPRDGHLGMQIGLREFRTADAQTLTALLRQPMTGSRREDSEDGTHA